MQSTAHISPVIPVISMIGVFIFQDPSQKSQMLAYMYIYMYTHTHIVHTHSLYGNICIYDLYLLNFCFKAVLFIYLPAPRVLAAACGMLQCGVLDLCTWDLVPWAGMPNQVCIEARSLSHWAMREVPKGCHTRYKENFVFFKYNWPTTLLVPFLYA